MNDYMCGHCEVVYSKAEYRGFERVPVNPNDDDPMKGSGYDKKCPECDKKMFSEKWQLRETITGVDGEEFTVSTVCLVIPHGLNHDQWYETCVFGPDDSRVTDRYETREEAKDGHQERIDRLESPTAGNEQ